MDESEFKDRQIWLRAFYGFDPENEGYYGFTLEPNRTTMLGRMRDGDLVLIYGAVHGLTQKDLHETWRAWAAALIYCVMVTHLLAYSECTCTLHMHRAHLQCTW